MNEITIDAYGKINLGLDVTGRRDDGYHIVRMIMQTVDICDRVTIRKDNSLCREKISLRCSNPKVPSDSTNLAWKAAEKVLNRFDLPDGISISIEKHIPMAAGMAGGSTDAAAVIMGMNKLFDLNMSTEDMDGIALSLGADVPFCLRRGTYLAEGIGEVLTKLKDAPEAYVLIVNPPFEVSTAQVYRDLDLLDSPAHPDIDGMISAINSAGIRELTGKMGNILSLVTEESNALIREIREKMMTLEALGSMMTGSGPTVFALYSDKSAAEKALAYFESDRRFGRCFLTTFIR